MKYYIECYYQDGGQILGNLDGQAVIYAKNYRRTNAYKRIVNIVNNTTSRVFSAKIVDSNNKVHETIQR